MDYDNNQLHRYLERIFNETTHKNRDNVVFHCCFCNHRKQKLSINLQNQVYHCWVCGVKGKGLHKIFKQLNTKPHHINEYNEHFKTKKQIKIEDISFYTEMYNKLYPEQHY